MAGEDRRGSQVGSIFGIVVGLALLGTGLFPLGSSIVWQSVIAGSVMIAGGGFGLSFSMNSNNAAGLRAKDFEFSTAGEGSPIPIVFGEQKIVGNFLGYDKSTFRSVEITGKRPKTLFGGGGRPVIGYFYHLTWEYGICAGPIDEIVQVWSTPGEVAMISDKTSIRQEAPYTGPALAHIATTDDELGYDNHASGPITFNVDVADNLSLNQVVLLGGVSFEVTAIAGLLITLSPVTLTDLPFSLPRFTAIYPRIPDVGQTLRLRFASTSGFVAGDTLTIPAIGVFTVTTIHNANDATVTVVSTMNQEYATGAEHVFVHRSTITEFDADYKEILLSSPGTSVKYGLTVYGPGDETGTVRIYRGTASQTRIADGDPYYESGMNYRYICWALFQDFQMGQIPQPKTYQFVVRRFPRVFLDDGTDLTASGFKVRGSADTTKQTYNEANPSAIAWEVLTNKIWGRGISSDLLDSDSFITASEYFEDHHIGMSLTIDTQVRVTEFLDGLLSQVKTILVWDNETLKMRVLLDPQQTHATIRTFRSSEVSDVSFTRPDWGSTINEVRAEFNSRDRNYRPSRVAVQNLANFETVGIINPHRISLNGITDHDLALEQATRILHEMSYPAGRLSFQINRFGCDLEPGSVIRLIWSEWSDSIVTGYFIVTAIEPGSSTRESIKVTAVEDPALGFVSGEETSTTPPGTQPWEHIRDVAIDDGGTYVPPDETLHSVYPAKVFEIPPIMTAGKRNLLLITGEQSSTAIDSIVGRWATDETTEEFYELGSMPTFSLTGTLLTDYEAGDILDRSSGGFQFSLTNASAENEATLLEADTVSDAGDDFEDLIESERFFALIGQELIQIGFIEKLGANQFRARNIIRGQGGTNIQNHFVLESLFIFPELPDEVFDADAIPTNKEIVFRAYPDTPQGEREVGDNLFINRDEQTIDRLFLGEGTRPLAPEPRSIDSSSDLLVIEVRPRFADKGAGIDSFEKSMSTPIADIAAMSFTVGLYNGAGDLMTRKASVSMVDNSLALGIDGDSSFSDPEAVGYYIPENIDDPNTGIAKIEYQVPFSIDASLVRRVRVFASLNGRESIEAAEFTVAPS